MVHLDGLARAGQVAIRVRDTLHFPPVESRRPQEAVFDGVQARAPGRGLQAPWGAGGRGRGAVGGGAVWKLGAGHGGAGRTAADAGLASAMQDDIKLSICLVPGKNGQIWRLS